MQGKQFKAIFETIHELIPNDSFRLMYFNHLSGFYFAAQCPTLTTGVFGFGTKNLIQ